MTSEQRAAWSRSHELSHLLAKRELAECMAELADLPTDATVVLLTPCRVEGLRQTWTEPWWQWITERVEPIGL